MRTRAKWKFAAKATALGAKAMLLNYCRQSRKESNVVCDPGENRERRRNQHTV